MATPITLYHLTQAYDQLAQSILLLDTDGKILNANSAFADTFSLNNQSLEGIEACCLAPLSNLPEFAWQQLFDVAKHAIWHNTFQSVDANNCHLTYSLRASSIHHQDNTILCYVLQFEPDDQASTQDKSLSHLAFRDGLTGLANRSLFDQLFEHEISRSERLELRFAVLFIDLDKFKQVNDNLGHDAGDVLLCAVADRLVKSLRKSDVVARLGGDEFAVLMNNIKDSETVARVTEKLIREIKKPVKSGAHLMEVGCSIGICVYPDNGKDAASLLQHADIAMYRAKQLGGGDYHYFSDALNQELVDGRQMASEIQRGIELNEFFPVFQPVIDQRKQKIVSLECFARWLHPHRGVLNAMEFIPVATKIGRIQQILDQILDKSFVAVKRWHDMAGRTIPLSINISSNEFYQSCTFDNILRLLYKHGLSAHAIRLEVTESTLQQSGESLVKRLKDIEQAEFGLTLDDFGTGYSSLRYLQQLPIDSLKIDRSFVRNIDNNPHDKIIIKAIIQLAQTLDIEAVAQGVENQYQADFLLEHDCSIMQGFLLSHALTIDEFEQYLTESLNLTADSIV